MKASPSFLIPYSQKYQKARIFSWVLNLKSLKKKKKSNLDFITWGKITPSLHNGKQVVMGGVVIFWQKAPQLSVSEAGQIWRVKGILECIGILPDL